MWNVLQDQTQEIKNTMSDRHVVEKKFNQLLEDYRNDVLPSIVESWDHISTEEQSRIGTHALSNFFCGLHVLVGMADTASAVLLQWEETYFGKSMGEAASCAFTKKSESGIVRLVRTACKALCKHASEQSGVYQPNASILSLEAMILFSNNKTAEWLNSKPKAEIRDLLQKARSVAPDFRELYKERRKKLLDERVELLKEKQRALQTAQEKSCKTKGKVD